MFSADEFRSIPSGTYRLKSTAPIIVDLAGYRGLLGSSEAISPIGTLGLAHKGLTPKIPGGGGGGGS